jgi:hypothetical protein
MTARHLLSLKKQLNESCLTGLLQWSLLILFVVGSLSCAGKTPATNANPAGSPVAQSSPPEAVAPKKSFETGEAVPAGYLGYKVVGSWFSGQGGNQLYVDLAIINTDKKERAVPALKLVDETGKEYALSAKPPVKGEGFLKLGNVGSNMSKRAIAVFEVPKGHQYKLKVQGFNPAEQVEINLKPAAAPPAG